MSWKDVKYRSTREYASRPTNLFWNSNIHSSVDERIRMMSILGKDLYGSTTISMCGTPTKQTRTLECLCKNVDVRNHVVFSKFTFSVRLSCTIWATIWCSHTFEITGAIVLCDGDYWNIHLDIHYRGWYIQSLQTWYSQSSSSTNWVSASLHHRIEVIHILQP